MREAKALKVRDEEKEECDREGKRGVKTLGERRKHWQGDRQGGGLGIQ